MIGKNAIRVIDTCLLRHPGTTDLIGMASSRTVERTVRDLEEMGVLERYAVKGPSAGRPKLRCRLTPAGLEFKRVLDDIRFRADFRRIEGAGIPVTVGLARSMAEGYGAPLVTGHVLAVLEGLEKKAKTLREWKDIRIEGVGLEGFAERGVVMEGLRYIGLEDVIVLAAADKKNPARLQACATTLVNDFAKHINWNLLLKLALKRKVVNEVGGLLFLTNSLAEKKVVRQEVLNKFLRHVVERQVKMPPRYEILVAQGIPPSEAEHPVDREIRKKWHTRLPTFEECREVFGWRGVGKVG